MAFPAAQKPPITSGPGRLLAGVASFSIDKNFFDVVSDLEWSPSSYRRETLVGLNGVHGYAEHFVPGFVSVTLRDTYATSVTNMNTLRGVNAVATLANGKTVTVTNGWSVEVQEVHSDEGTFKVRLESDIVFETQGGGDLIPVNVAG